MRILFVLILAIVTLISAIETMIQQSVMIGLAALAATTLAFVAASTFVASYLARREKKYTALDLVGIGTIASLFAFGGFALAYWSRFQVNAVYGVVDGFDWLLIAMVVGLLVARKSDAFDGRGLSAALLGDEQSEQGLGRSNPSTLQQLQAERGNLKAQYALGGAYYNGNGMARNAAQGAQWLLKAAEGGYPPAQCDLGVMYQNGVGVNQSFKGRPEMVLQSRRARRRFCVSQLGFPHREGVPRQELEFLSTHATCSGHEQQCRRLQVVHSRRKARLHALTER